MSSPLIPTVVVEVIATVSGVIVSIGIPLVLAKLNKINKLHTTVFGLQEVSSVEGLVDKVDDNQNRIENIENSQSRIENKIDDLTEKIENCFDELPD